MAKNHNSALLMTVKRSTLKTTIDKMNVKMQKQYQQE